MSAPSAARPETKPLTYEVLKQAVTGSAAAFRCRRKLQPAGGPGDKVFPPTFAGAVYAIEERRMPDCKDPVTCVLLDSVQSQANRMEQALQDAVDAGRIHLPIIAVDFEPAFKEGKLQDNPGRITSLQAPHRLADAILRDSEYPDPAAGGKPVRFRLSSIGKPINDASPRNATAIYQLCPTALLFGMWDSTGPKGGLGAKFERAMVSEIVGVNAAFGVRVSSRIDPVITKTAGIIAYKKLGGGWTPFEADAAKEKGKPLLLGRGAKSGKLSNANLGNVLPAFSTYQEGAAGPDPLSGDAEARQGQIAPGGATFDHALQTTTLSLAVLRRLRFPLGGASKPPADDAARVTLAALGLAAWSLAFAGGADLRSRCSLVPEEPEVFYLLDREGAMRFTLGTADALDLFGRAAADAAAAGLEFAAGLQPLLPGRELLEAVARSQRKEAAGEGGEEDED